jgi:hypothetical protein
MKAFESSRLRIGYESPGEVYRGTRFDWSSAIVAVELDGGPRFGSSEYTAEDARYLDGGRGLACEFGIHTPVSYDDCAVGDWFPKLGVGFLRREGEAPYDFFHRYGEVREQRYEIDASGAGSVRIEGVCEPYRGCGWRLTRTWRAEGSALECSSKLENIGERPIETDEYCHNFVRLAAASVGPDYRIDFSFPIPEAAPEVDDPSGCLRGARPEFTREPSTDFYLGGLMSSPADDPSWLLRDERTGLSISERLSGRGIRCALWGRSHVISPELFIRISVEPGASQEWTRSWEFGC